MELVNKTRMQAGWTLGFEPDGRELLVVAVKGTFVMPFNDEKAVLAEEQVPLTESDQFTGEPGFSATLYESDYAHRKPLCDVVLNGSAYAPGGRPTTKVRVCLQVGEMKKSFLVVSDRVWQKGWFFGVKPSKPLPFIRLPITYDRAFGGADKDEKKPDKVATYAKNPIGVGFYPLAGKKALIGKALPNTCEIGKGVTKRKGKYEPMSFGFIGRNVPPRPSFAGTYDQAWLDTRAPFWPDNFDYRYFQSASPDQQIPHPTGGEWVALENLTPPGITRFRLPTMELTILVLSYRGKEQEITPVIDTVILEPDQQRFMLTWRVSLPLRKNCFEVRQVVIGKTLAEHRREISRATKKHYASLNDLVREKLQRGQEVMA
jgi:hypothetical protein